jgi:O-antigen/teichoic acid export membrane protein
LERVVDNRETKPRAVDGRDLGDIGNGSVRYSGMTLRSNFLWTLGGNVVYAGCQWGILVVLARLGSPDIVGRFALGLAVSAPVFMFANLNLRAAIATDSRKDYHFGDYLALRLATSALALVLITAIAFGARYGRETALVIVAVGFAKMFESVSDIFYGLLQQHERMDRIALSMAMKGLLSLVALVVAVYVTGSVVWGSAGLAATWALVLLIYDIRSGTLLRGITPESDRTSSSSPGRPCNGPRWSAPTLISLAGLSLPLGVSMMFISLGANIPRYFIARCLGERELGIFAALTYLMVAGTTVVSALAQSAVPRLAKYYASGNAQAYTALLIKLLWMGAVMGGAGLVAAVFAGKWLLFTLYGTEYARSVRVFIWIAVASAVSLEQWFLSNGMSAARQFRIQAPLYASTTAVTAVACLLLVPRWGLLGAALAILVGQVLLAAATLLIDIQAISTLRKQSGEPGPRGV